MRAQESARPFVNAAAGTSTAFILQGGRYAFAFNGTGTGTVDLRGVGPDGATAIAVGLTQITATAGYQVVELPPGSYTVVIATFTANYVSLTRIPGE